MTGSIDFYKAGQSPWSLKHRIGVLCWEICWSIFCSWTPKPANAWRLLILRSFGAAVGPNAFVHQRARIAVPWHLEMQERATLGDRANIYALAPIVIGKGATIAQEAYICAGTHNFSSDRMELLTREIQIGEGAFVGARAFVMPGVRIGEYAVVGACSVVTRDVPPWKIVAGNPAQVVKEREIADDRRPDPHL